MCCRINYKFSLCFLFPEKYIYLLLRSQPEIFSVFVEMTLTAVGCGMGPVLVQEIEHKVSGLPHVENVDVQLVFDPPWDQSMMTEVAQLQLGLL